MPKCIYLVFNDINDVLSQIVTNNNATKSCKIQISFNNIMFEKYILPRDTKLFICGRKLNILLALSLNSIFVFYKQIKLTRLL